MTKLERYKKLLSELNVTILKIYKNKKLQIYSYIRLGMLTKYYKSIKAICCLDQNGFFEDANIILRTVFENFITIMFCELNPQKYYERFFDYNVVIRLKYLIGNNDIKEIIQKINPEEIETLKLKKDKFCKKYKVKGIKYWNDKNVWEMCKELDKSDKDTFYISMYDIIYKQYSEFVHPNVVNLFEEYIGINNKKIKCNLKTQKDEKNKEIIEILEKINSKLINKIIIQE